MSKLILQHFFNFFFAQKCYFNQIKFKSGCQYRKREKRMSKKRRNEITQIPKFSTKKAVTNLLFPIYFSFLSRNLVCRLALLTYRRLTTTVLPHRETFRIQELYPFYLEQYNWAHHSIVTFRSEIWATKFVVSFVQFLIKIKLQIMRLNYTHTYI